MLGTSTSTDTRRFPWTSTPSLSLGCWELSELQLAESPLRGHLGKTRKPAAVFCCCFLVPWAFCLAAPSLTVYLHHPRHDPHFTPTLPPPSLLCCILSTSPAFLAWWSVLLVECAIESVHEVARRSLAPPAARLLREEGLSVVRHAQLLQLHLAVLLLAEH